MGLTKPIIQHPCIQQVTINSYCSSYRVATHNRNSIVYGSSKKQFARAPSNSIKMARIAPLPSPFRSYRWLWIYQEGGCAATITHLYKETSSWLAMQTRKIAHNKFGDDSRRCRKTSCNDGQIMNIPPLPNAFSTTTGNSNEKRSKWADSLGA